MIFAILFHHLLSFSSAGAFSISMPAPVHKVVEDNHTYLCENIPSSSTFLCNSEVETTKSILILNNYRKDSIIFDKKRGVFEKPKSIKYFKDNNEEIISIDGQASQTIADSLNTQAIALKKLFYKQDENNNEIEISGSPKFEEIKKEGIKKILDLQSQLDLILSNLELKINDKRFECNRLKSKVSTSQCSIFECSDNQDTKVMVGLFQTIQGTYSSSIVYMKNNEIFNTPAGDIYLGDSKNNEVIKSYKNEYSESMPGTSGSKIYPSSFSNKNQAALFVLNPAMVGLFTSMLSVCSEDAEKKFYKAQQGLIDDIGQFELKEYITQLGNMTLNSFIHPENLTSASCELNGKLYSPEAFQKLNEIQNFYQSSFQEKNVITPEKASRLFEMALKNKEIYWENTNDGCYARAEIMKKQFQEENIHVDKAWIAGDLSDGASNKVKSWDYHVAPLVYVKGKNGEVQKMVIDPALFDGPVTVEKWIARTTEKSKYKNIETVFPMPVNNFYAGKNTYTITNGEIYSIKDSSTLTGDKAYSHALDMMKAMRVQDAIKP